MKRIILNFPFGSLTLNHLRAELPIRFLEAPLASKGIDLTQKIIKTTENCQCYCFANCPEPASVPGILELARFTRLCWTNDDNFFSIHPDNPCTRHIGKMDLYGLRQCLDTADFRWTTTEPLAKILKNADILPNLIDVDEYEAPQRTKKGCLWSGSPTHLADLDHLGDITTKMSNTEFHFLGLTPRQNTRISAKGINVHTDPIGENVFYYPMVNFPVYHESINYIATQCSVGLAPLHNDEFNVCKSILRVQEMWALGLTVVASDAYPYNQVIQDGVTGYIAWNDNWEAAIEAALEVPLNMRDFVASEWSWQSQHRRDHWQEGFEHIVNSFTPPKAIRGL